MTGYNDSVEGSWTASYDAVHRLVKSTGTTNGVAATFQQTYDHFDNRNVEYLTYNGVQSQPTPYLNFTTGNNRAASSTYDNAGNLLSDGTNNYLYDAENRLCAVKQLTSGDLIGYVYAANGPRLGKGNLTSFSCDVTKNGLLTANGLALTNAYVAGPQWERLEETDANFNMLHYNVFWEGKLLGTYTGTTYAQSNWHFALNDWVGTKRELTTSTGASWTSLSSGPFGDYASQTGSGSNPSEELFTSKVRDTESGLDDFLARHYSSNWGRFMSPDPGWYFQADVRNPQSWNQYSYVLNNPLINTDPDGRECVWDDGSYDSADDKQTGNAEGCSSQGGTYVPPANFENSLLTNGQMSNVQRGDWSPDANSTIASSWVNNTPDVTASPMQNGDLTSNMSMNDFISMMQQSNFYLSDMDQALANHHLSVHSGIQMRQDKEGCNLHVNIDRNSGQNGQPVKGDFHYDVLNPNPNSYPTDSLITAPLHAAEAVVDIGMTKAGVSGTVGDRACLSH